MPSEPRDFDLPDLDAGPPVRELPASEPSTFSVESIELDVPPRQASVRPEVPIARAHEDLARVDAVSLDVARADVRGIEVELPPPRAIGSVRPPASVAPMGPLASVRPGGPGPSFAPRAPLAPIPRTAANEAIARAPREFDSTFQYDTPLVNAAALPAAFGIALLVHLMGLGLTVFMTVGMWTHEMGHAITAWFSGFLAIPLPFVTITTSDERNVVVILLVAASWIALGAHGFRSKNRALVGSAIALAILQIMLTGVMNPGRANQWILFAGMGGEIVLSTIGILAFYQRFPLRWDFWRYLVLVTCAIAYVHSLLRWIGVGLLIIPMPHGSASGDNAEGDVERLLRTNEFTLTALARTYLAVSLVCGGVMVLAYLFYLRRAKERARLEASGALSGLRDGSGE